jgi:folate-binding protein YgfZ
VVCWRDDFFLEWRAPLYAGDMNHTSSPADAPQGATPSCLPDLADAVALLDSRRTVRVAGADRLSFLDATLSQAVADLAAGMVRSALWLDIHGAPLAAIDIISAPGTTELLLVTEAEEVAILMEKLAMRTFLSDAVFTATEDIVVAVRLPGGGSWPDASAGQVERDGDVLVVVRRGGADIIGAGADVLAWCETNGLGAPAADPAAISDLEVRNGVPRRSHEIVAPHLPEESGILATHVHLAKGCYPGQEAVARMWMLGKPRRRLVTLELTAKAVAGDEVGSGRGRLVVTRVTSASPWAALAYAPAGASVGEVFQGEGWQGTVRTIVGQDTSQPGADPRVTRRRDR